MNELFEKMAAGVMPDFLDVMQAISDGTEKGWEFDDSGRCPYGQNTAENCELGRSAGQRCLSCY
jgi:hypothetical protein